MSHGDLLSRRYRRLLWSYPRWYRRQRGVEMVTTLLDAARPGQRRPTPREIIDLVAGGFRCRLRPPGTAARLLATAAALLAALVGSAVATIVTIPVLAAPPSEDDAVAVAVMATGQPPNNVPGGAVWCPFLCLVDWAQTGDQVLLLDYAFDRNGGVDQVMVAYWTPNDQMEPMVATARSRLAAHGWRVGEVDTWGDGGRSLTAAKDGVQVRLTAVPGTASLVEGGVAGSDPPVSLTLQRQRPALVEVMSAVGFVSGGLAGWMMMCWVSRRFVDHGYVRRVAIRLIGIPTLLIAVSVELRIGLLVVVGLSGVNDHGGLALIPGIGLSFLLADPKPLVVGAIGTAAILILAGAPRRARPPRPAPTPVT